MSIYKLSFKNLKRRKLRSALTMLGIIIGVGTLVLLIGAGTGMQSYIKEQTETMMGDVSIYNSSGGGYMGSGDSYLDQATISKIKNMSQLYDFKEEVQFTTDMDKTPIYVVGMSDWSQVKFNGTPGVVVDQSLVDNFGYKIGAISPLKTRTHRNRNNPTELWNGDGLCIFRYR
jgi:putative ABC transport system permease protein